LGVLTPATPSSSDAFVLRTPSGAEAATRLRHERPQKRISGTVEVKNDFAARSSGDGPLNGRGMTVSFVGLGYVGLCTAVAFADRGFDTLGVDVDPERLALVEVGRAPIHEPGLERLLKKAVLSGRLHVSDDLADVAQTDVIFLTVGTPSRFDGSIDTSHVERASREVGAALRSERDMRLVVVKSTVVPGTTRSVVKPLLEESSGKHVGVELGLCTNPEFLKEGSAIEDTFHPDKLVIGGIDGGSVDRLKRLYRAFYGEEMPPTIETTPETAEMIKYASNAFLATKVSYINTIANIAQLVPGLDVEQVASAIGLDPRIGPLFLRAGPGYGGSCFPKDVRALIAFSRERGYDPGLLAAVEKANERQASKVVELSEKLVGSLEDKRVAVLGLAFKKDTDDVREAASIRVIHRLQDKGARVTAYDPMAIPSARRLLGTTVEFAADPKSAIDEADCCIIMTEWDEFRCLKGKDFAERMRKPNVVDARRLYQRDELEGVNVLAIGMGRSSSVQEHPAPDAKVLA